MSRVAREEGFIPLLFLRESFGDVTDQAVLVLRYVHHVEVVPQEVSDFADFGARYGLALGDDGATNFALFMEHGGEFGVVRLNGAAAVFDGDFLVVDELCDDAGDVQFLPPVGDAFVAALDVQHGGAQFFDVLDL